MSAFRVITEVAVGSVKRRSWPKCDMAVREVNPPRRVPACHPAIGPAPSARQTAEEIDHRSIDFVWALLLGPVAAARKHQCVAQRGDEVLEVGE
jgi:hypothetical protein